MKNYPMASAIIGAGVAIVALIFTAMGQMDFKVGAGLVALGVAEFIG
jgi:hypothetical protein